MDGVISDALLTGTNGGFLRIEHAYSAASVLDYGRIANCECAGTNYYTLLLSWENGSGSSVTNGIDIENNRLFNSGSTGTFGTPGPATLLIQGSSSEVTVPAAIRLTGNKFSYGGVVAYPVGTNDINTGLMSLSAYNNRLNEGAYFLTGFGGVGTMPNFENPLTGTSTFYMIQQENNGLPGDSVVLSGFSSGVSNPPGAGTWQYGDRNKRITPLASTSPPTYISYDECIAPGTYSGQMTGCAINIGSLAQVGTYTGTPPLPGEWITITDISGAYQIVYANNGNIGLQPFTAAGTSGMYESAAYSVPTFTTNFKSVVLG